MYKFLDNSLNNKKSKYFRLVHLVLLIVTFVAIFSLVLDNSHKFNAIEWLCVAIFTAEYLARIWTSKKKVSYILSLWGIFDLVSILPSYLGLGNWTFLKSVRIVRFFRILKSAHIGKLSEEYTETKSKKIT